MTAIETTAEVPQPELCGSRLAGKYLSFFLGGEEYALEILRVQEIIGLIPISPIPRAPQAMRGVVNLRGQVIPVVDLRTRFGLEQREDTSETCIIVVQKSDRLVGIVVDRVSEVTDIQASEIDPPPVLDAAPATDFILGIGKGEGKVRMLLDIECVLSGLELARHADQ